MQGVGKISVTNEKKDTMIPHLSPVSFRTQPSWNALVDGIADYHLFPKPEIQDVLLGPDEQTLLSRTAWIDGLGFGVKSATICRDNKTHNLPTVQGLMTLFDSENGAPLATLDNNLITCRKTAADSLLGARLLARKDSRVLLIIGAGLIAQTLIQAYPSVLPSLSKILIWNRTPEAAEKLASRPATMPLHAVKDLGEAVAQADIVTTATLSNQPVLCGDWVQPGTHVDLIGAYKANMREADDKLVQNAQIFVDCRETTAQIGELLIPLQNGTITPDDIRADFYDLIGGTPGRQNEKDITLFKNGGGAHLDLMVARVLYDRFMKEST